MTETIHEVIHSHPTPDTFFLTINHPYVFTTRTILCGSGDEKRIVIP